MSLLNRALISFTICVALLLTCFFVLRFQLVTSLAYPESSYVDTEITLITIPRNARLAMVNEYRSTALSREIFEWYIREHDMVFRRDVLIGNRVAGGCVESWRVADLGIVRRETTMHSCNGRLYISHVLIVRHSFDLPERQWF